MNVQPNFVTPPEQAIHLSRMAERLDNMERFKERWKYEYILEKMVTENLDKTFGGADARLQQEVAEVSRNFEQLMAKTTLGEKLEEDVLQEVHALKEKVDKIVSKHFLSDKEALKHQLEFEKLRADSISYLSSWDNRGLWGWQKVDGAIQNLVKLMHQNPHLFHYGESCEGHIHDPTKWSPEKKLSGGYINIGIDGTQESRDIIAKIQLIAEKSDYVKLKADEAEGVEVYNIRVDKGNLSDEIQKSRTLEEHKIEYDKVWQAIEEVLNEAARGYKPVNWNNELSKSLNLVF